jgi:polyisoprenyl-phosphate glycosyltransferase
MKKISVVTPTYNEELNAEDIYSEVKKIMKGLPYPYEHLFIDNASTDKTVDILRKIASKDKNVKIIVNARNFGHIRSPYYGLTQTNSDAAVLIYADLQDPPQLIKKFVEEWEKGNKIVMGVKNASKESSFMYNLRKTYYRSLRKIAEVDLVENFTGFGLYDRRVIEEFRKIDDQYPYLRGLAVELGFQRKIVPYTQQRRKKGRSNNNFFTLYDMAMVGLVNNSKIPLRVATFIGFITAFLSLAFALFYLIYKIIFWDKFEVGMAPLVIGLFFLGSVQLIFLGVIGEYIGAIFTQVRKRPLVIEKERINF